MQNLNYHHLRYFHAVATEGHLGRAAQKMNLSQSALSIQIKQLETRLGQALFDRVGRTLALTEAGRIALDHADAIFKTGNDLLSTLAQQPSQSVRAMRVGALSTLSRNFQLQFLRPLLDKSNCDLSLKSGDTDTLLAGLRNLTLDVVLTTEIPASSPTAQFAAHPVAQQAVGLHGVPARMDYPDLRSLLQNEPLILPSETVIRARFQSIVAALGVSPRVAASVDDMAMVRLLAREGVGVAVAPAVVLADEIATGRIATAPFDLQIIEPFYAVTMTRRFPHPQLGALLGDDTSP